MGKKEEKLTALKKHFQERKLLVIEDLFKILNTRNRKTVNLYLKELNYLTSYSHGGKYYTLHENASYDEVGIWYSGDIGFSKHGTLLDTILHLVEHSNAGKTGAELQQQCCLRVQNALLNLIQAKKIDREKLTGKLYVYLSTKPEKGKHQLTVRRESKTPLQIPQWIVIEVLVEIIRTSSQVVSLDTVASSLKKRGSSITREQIHTVFQRYDLEKKMPDCTP